jgi:hypothetical protein
VLDPPTGNEKQMVSVRALRASASLFQIKHALCASSHISQKRIADPDDFPNVQAGLFGQKRLKPANGIAVACVCGLMSAFAAQPGTPPRQAEANRMIELTFTSASEHPDPFNSVTFDAIFTEPTGHQLRVPGFWAGTNLWKVRYASPLTGTHRFSTVCSDAADKGLHGIEGEIVVRPYQGTNLFYLHGPLKVSTDHRHFEHFDGTPFFWLGDTWWMGLVNRLHWPEDVQTLAQDRRSKGFNVIQIVAGLFPDMYPFDPRGENEAGCPWQTNYTAIRPEYFDAADQRLLYLAEQGFSPCIVGAWGYFMQWMGPEKLKQHWRYLIARYGALPVVWCVAGEANLPWYLAKGFPFDDREQVKHWTEVARYVRETDPFHRLITIHPTGIGRPTARRCVDEPALLDFDMLQTPDGQREAVAPTVKAARESYLDQPVMPVIDGEASFEMLGDSIKTEWTRRMFWVCLLNGAAGHTYGANGIWQVNRKGHPHGSSPGGPPNGPGYGIISWDEAMNLGGSKQVGLGKRFLEQLPWRQFEPHPEWASLVGPTALSLSQAKWIWFPEGDPLQDAPAEKRYFRRYFVLPAASIIGARLRITADDQYSASLNEHVVGKSDTRGLSWKTPEEFEHLAPLLKPGTNLLSVTAENRAADGQNPAGLIGCLEIGFADRDPLRICTDGEWLASQSEKANSNWINAKVLCGYGEGPWGAVGSSDSPSVPQCAGTADVRIYYFPEARSARIQSLRPNTAYSRVLFDPTSGNTRALAPATADSNGVYVASPPPSAAPDWVLVLKAARDRTK